jgi:hypothetical protein
MLNRRDGRQDRLDRDGTDVGPICDQRTAATGLGACRRAQGLSPGRWQLSRLGVHRAARRRGLRHACCLPSDPAAGGSCGGRVRAVGTRSAARVDG